MKTYKTRAEAIHDVLGWHAVGVRPERWMIAATDGEYVVLAIDGDTIEVRPKTLDELEGTPGLDLANYLEGCF